MVKALQPLYYSILKEMIQDKRNWIFADFLECEKPKVIAVQHSPNGQYTCKIEWSDSDTFDINFYRQIDKTKTSLFYIKSNSHLLLGLADDFKNLYEYRNTPDSDAIEKLESILSNFIFE